MRRCAFHVGHTLRGFARLGVQMAVVVGVGAACGARSELRVGPTPVAGRAAVAGEGSVGASGEEPSTSGRGAGGALGTGGASSAGTANVAGAPGAGGVPPACAGPVAMQPFGATQWEEPLAITVAGDDIYIASRFRNEAGTEHHSLLRRFTRRGALLSETPFRFASDDESRALAADDAGTVHLAGVAIEPVPNSQVADSDALLARVEAGTSVSWATTSKAPGDEFATGIAPDTNGELYVVGYAWERFGAGQAGGFIRKYSRQGQLLWSQVIGSSSVDRVHAVVTDGQGNAHLAGARLVDGSAQGFVRKVERNGLTLWERSLGAQTRECTAIAVARDGSAYVGCTGVAGALLQKVAATGDPLWHAEVNFDQVMQTTGVAVDAGGDVFLAGWGSHQNSHTAFVRKYDPTGAAMADVPVSGVVNGIAADSECNVYLVGRLQIDVPPFEVPLLKLVGEHR